MKTSSQAHKTIEKQLERAAIRFLHEVKRIDPSIGQCGIGYDVSDPPRPQYVTFMKRGDIIDQAIAERDARATA